MTAAPRQQIDPAELGRMFLLSPEALRLALAWPRAPRQSEGGPGLTRVPGTDVFYDADEWARIAGVSNPVVLSQAADVLFGNGFIAANGVVQETVVQYATLQVTAALTQGKKGKGGKRT